MSDAYDRLIIVGQRSGQGTDRAIEEKNSARWLCAFLSQLGNESFHGLTNYSYYV